MPALRRSLISIAALSLLSTQDVRASGLLDFLTGKSFERNNAKENNQRQVEEYHAREAAAIADAERQNAQWKAEQERKAQEEIDRRDARALDLKAGKIKPETPDDLEDLYDALPGWDLAESPLLIPDKEIYVITGQIERPEAGVLVCRTVTGPGKYDGDYFAVNMTAKTKKPSDYKHRLRVNGRIFAVGRYNKNLEYITVAGQRKLMPIIDAVHILLPDN